MPRAPEYLRQQWADDFVALNYLRPNFTFSRGGVIRPKIPGYVPTEMEASAIDYLFFEWDYGYTDSKAEGKP